MSERKLDKEIAQREYANEDSLIDQNDIIDVYAFDFDDTQTWLYKPTQRLVEPTVHDLYAWLRNESDLATLNIENTSRRCIDTRTFTRPKKRSSRASFESIFEGLSSPMQNLWKNQYSSLSNADGDKGKNSSYTISHKEDNIPAMLKLGSIPAANLLANESLSMSGQESMEVFLNMSHSKGIDSFINLTDPELNDPLMNVSQPSIFYSSITSLCKDDTMKEADFDRTEEPENLTQTIIHNVNDVDGSRSPNYMNETFSTADTTIENLNICEGLADKTFVNYPEEFQTMDMNATYNANMTGNTIVLSSSNTDKRSTTNLSSTFSKKEDPNSKLLDVENHERGNIVCLDATYLSLETNQKLDSTYLSLETDKVEKDATLTIGISAHEVVNDVNNAGKNTTYTPQSGYESNLDSTFKLPFSFRNQSTPKSAETLNSTFNTVTKNLDQTRTYNPTSSGTFKAPTSLRRELLAEIHRSGERRLDSTYNHIGGEQFTDKDRKESFDLVCDENIRNDIPKENKYNTYKKESSSYRMQNKVDALTNNVEVSPQKDQHDRKYYTFTKKSLAHGGKTDMENAESLEKVNSTFTKPLPKLSKKKQQHIPRVLSKLPQFLQKSNPNLVSSSLKTVNMAECTDSSSLAYMKGSQPNIVRDVEKSLTNKLYALGKMKSGSEQRLLELHSNAGEFQLTGAGGSTESIESTQSAHSAPDLDDRLSTCSDSSHNSYTTQTMNLEQLHQIVRMQEESLKHDCTPKLNRRVLENTWIEAKKDLPSPIQKNGVNDCNSDSTFQLTIDSTMKTSSPLISPTESSQSINTDDNIMKPPNEVVAGKKEEVLNKPVARPESKTRLRPPTNWAAGNRPPNALSAIPRPASRIPAPRFTRPALKTTQGEVKKGY